MDQSTNYDKLKAVYNKYFSLNYLGKDLGDKLALIAIICYLTNKLKQKNSEISCYQVISKIAGTTSDNGFLEALAVVCEDFMYGCDTFPDFGVSAQEMPKTAKKLIGRYIPF